MYVHDVYVHTSECLICEHIVCVPSDVYMYTHDEFRMCVCARVYTNSDVYVCALVLIVTSVCVYLVTS